MTRLRAFTVAGVRDIVRSRAWWWTFLAAATLAGALTGGLVAASEEEQIADVTTAWGQGEVIIDPLTGLILGVMAAAYWGSLHKDGALLWHYLAGAPRWVVFVSAVVVTTAICVAAAALVMGVKLAVLTATLLPSGTELAWWRDAHGVTAMYGALVAAAFLGAVSTSVAFITRNAALAIGLVLTWLLVVEPITANLLPDRFTVYFPGQAMALIRNAADGADQGQAGLVIVLAVGVVVGLGLALASRRDPA